MVPATNNFLDLLEVNLACPSLGFAAASFRESLNLALGRTSSIEGEVGSLREPKSLTSHSNDFI